MANIKLYFIIKSEKKYSWKTKMDTLILFRTAFNSLKVFCGG